MTVLESTWTEVSRTPNRRKCDEHALVLQAVGIPCGRMSAESAWLLLVKPEDAPRARTELERYERENVGWPPREPYEPPISSGVYGALVYAALLALVYIWQPKEHEAGRFGIDWLAAGRAHADAIVHGEWWRAITALTLHGDVMHLLGNILFGGVFGVLLAHSIGVGPAWLATLAAGTIGNLLNAWIQDGGHGSLGASTAVFGALGVQVAYEWKRRHDQRRSRRRRWAPVIAGIALLGWLGTGGSFSEGATTQENLDELQRIVSRVDVMAHVTGFGAGIVLGALLGSLRERLVLTPRWQLGLALAAPAVIVAAWAIALTHGAWAH